MRARGAGHRLIGALAALALLAAGACGLGGDDDYDARSEGAPPEGVRTPDDLDADAGCGDEASTDPADLAADRIVARCASGAPEAVPLAEPASLRVGVRGPTEDLAPILLADHFDEFAAENLSVELVDYETSAEVFAALADGEVDVVAGDLDGPFFDGVADQSGARLVLGGPVAPAALDTSTPQTGLWLRTDLLSEPADWQDLQAHDQTVAVEDSIGDAVVYPIDFVLQQGDVTLNEVHLVVEGGAAAADNLLSGELSAAWLTDPYWRDVLDSDLQIELVATLPAAESLGGVVFAEPLVDPDAAREVGVAFSRAVIRTINTYLGAEYQDDDEVVDALVELTEQSEDDIVDTPAWVFDWELRRDTTSRLQDALLVLGGLRYEHELPERQVVDRSLYEDAVGRDQDQG